MTAVPNTGFHFVDWSDGVLTAARTDLDITANLSVTANFAPDTFTLTYSTGAGGSITGVSPQTVAYGEDGTPVTAVPNTGYHFVSWSDESTANPRTDLDVTSNLSVTAVFEQDAVTLTVNVTGSGSVSQAPEPPYLYGTSVELTAVPLAGWHFVRWTGDLTGSVNPETITLNGNKTVTAVFEQDAVTLTVNVTGSGSVSQDPEPPYLYGASVELTAVPLAGWHFVRWTGDLTGSVNPETITLNGNKTVTAVFEQDAVTLTITPPTGGTITADPAGPYTYGAW